jgi:hypothetical protein
MTARPRPALVAPDKDRAGPAARRQDRHRQQRAAEMTANKHASHTAAFLRWVCFGLAALGLKIGKIGSRRFIHGYRLRIIEGRWRIEPRALEGPWRRRSWRNRRRRPADRRRRRATGVRTGILAQAGAGGVAGAGAVAAGLVLAQQCRCPRNRRGTRRWRWRRRGLCRCWRRRCSSWRAWQDATIGGNVSFNLADGRFQRQSLTRNVFRRKRRLKAGQLTDKRLPRTLINLATLLAWRTGP